MLLKLLLGKGSLSLCISAVQIGSQVGLEQDTHFGNEAGRSWLMVQLIIDIKLFIQTHTKLAKLYHRGLYFLNASH